MDLESDGLGFQSRVGEPETTGVTGQSGPLAAFAGVGVQSMPDTSGPGPTALQQPGAWAYDFNPASGSSRATFNGEVVPSGGGGPGAGVSTFNTRTGDVTLSLLDVMTAGAAPNASPLFTGQPRAVNTPPPGDSGPALATTAFVQQAIVAGSGVSTFNTRSGAVTLNSADIMGAGGAPLASPAFTGAPTAPTASLGDTSNQVATDAFVANAIAGGSVTTFNGRRGAVLLTLSDVQSVGGAPINSPTFTGTPSVPTATAGSATTQAASTAFVTNAITAGTAGVSSFNTRTGAIVFTASDLTSVGGAFLASPAFIGTPTAPTPTAGDSSTKLATTAYVETAIGSLPSGVSTFNGRTGTVTLALTDVTSVGGAPLASPTFTGTPSGPTPPALDNSTRFATTAFVDALVATLPAVPVASSTTPLMDGTAAVGNGTTWARSNHVHPSDTSKLSLTGGTLSGLLTANGGVQAAGLTSTSGFTVSGQNIQLQGPATVTIAAYSGPPAPATVRWTESYDGDGNGSYNYLLTSYDNSGAATGQPLRISRTSLLATFGGAVNANGFGCQAGVNGGRTGAVFSLDWISPNFNFWVGSTLVGSLSYTCDYRIKQDVTPLASMWDRVKALNPISFTHKEYSPENPDADQGGDAPTPLFEADGVERWGFIAHELQETLIPSAASGVKDAPNEVQTPNLLALVATLTRALQEAMTRIEALEAA